MIGRSRAVADLGRIRLRGFPAWLFWSLVHLFLLAGFRNRIVVYVDWSWAWFTYGRGARLIIGEATLEQQQNTNPAGLVQAHRAVSR